VAIKLNACINLDFRNKNEESLQGETNENSMNEKLPEKSEYTIY
jgi:hypothetical protein